MNGVIIGALVALGAMQQTDTTLALEGAELLGVETLGGSIAVDVWDRDEVRVRAEHSTRTFVEIERRRGRIEVESEARRGPANLVDFQITVPRSLSLDLQGQYGDVVVEGSDGAIEVETLRGDVTIRGGRGNVRVANTIGNILVEGAAGEIDVESTAADIRVVNSSGRILAETTGGTVVLENVTASSVDVGSVGGRVHYDGTFQPGGTYFFGAHGGSITIVVPDGAGMTLSLASLHGSITSNLSGEIESFRSGERHQLEIGGGGAVVEAETYGGRIRVVRRGTEGSQAPSAGRADAANGEAGWHGGAAWHGGVASHGEADWHGGAAWHGEGHPPSVATWVSPQLEFSVRNATETTLSTKVELRRVVAAATIRR